jgi:hypothetical protein
MPSHLHEALLQLFRCRPTLAPELVRSASRVEVPFGTSARIHSPDLSEVRSVQAARIAAAAQRACSCLDNDRAGPYLDLIHLSLSEAARRVLREMLPANYEYQSDFARKYYGQGKTDGRHQTLIDLVTKQLSLRFGPLDATALRRISTASDAALEQIAERLLTAPTLEAALSTAVNGQEG